VKLREVVESFNKFPAPIDYRLIPLWKRVIARLFGYCFLTRAKPKGFTAYEMFYVLYCKKHNIYYVDYPHGHEEYFYLCPYCLREIFKDTETLVLTLRPGEIKRVSNNLLAEKTANGKIILYEV
jgi:hypothetical protein